MKIICTTERKIEEETTCKKEYCCKKMKKAMNTRKYGKSSYEYMDSNFEMTDTGIDIQTHSSYEHGSHDEEINFCPWCATPVKIERVKVDNTGLPPRPLPEPVAEKTVAEKKKKHWWNL